MIKRLIYSIPFVLAAPGMLSCTICCRGNKYDAPVTMNDSTALQALAGKLASGTYGPFFYWPEHDQTVEKVWAGKDHPRLLEMIIADTAWDDSVRFLAAQVLFKKDYTFLRRVEITSVAQVYASALKKNYTGYTNSWGLLYEYNDAGPTGNHFLMMGKPAAPVLKDMLNDVTVLQHYSGSEEATVGNGRQYRVKDFAAYYLARIYNIPIVFHKDFEERDAEIEKLKQQLQK